MRYPALTRILSSDPSLKPPKKWADKMLKEIKQGNPSYSEDKVNETMGDIWYHKLDDSKRKEIRHREGKEYGPAESATEADLDEGTDLEGFHKRLRKAAKQIRKAIEEVSEHDPEQDEVAALQECLSLLEQMGGSELEESLEAPSAELPEVEEVPDLTEPLI